jgi:hypothetical protein
MNGKITIIAQGETVREAAVQEALGSIEDLKLTRVGPSRGSPLEGAAKVVTWICEFVGSTTKLADALLEQTTKQLAGATIKVQYGPNAIEITNANRSQLVELLEQVRQMSKETEDL